MSSLAGRRVRFAAAFGSLLALSLGSQIGAPAPRRAEGGGAVQEPRRGPVGLEIVERNGKNGRPVAGDLLNVWVGGGSPSPTLIKTGRDGVARITARLGVRVRYLSSKYLDCRKGASPPESVSYSVARIAHAGVVTENACGSARADPEPGKIITFVRPFTIWERFRF